MEAVLQSFLAGFPVLMLHFSVTVAMLCIGSWLYYKWTSYCEITLIRDGNMMLPETPGHGVDPEACDIETFRVF